VAFGWRFGLHGLVDINVGLEGLNNQTECKIMALNDINCFIVTEYFIAQTIPALYS